ncbi:FecR family protein [Pedobacter sp. GR22-6]|uniref:FecR family protein n=1 Tax=Pedobacter sp. GR22-6 TaxID=3127957 RepID=UPI00307E1338
MKHNFSKDLFEKYIAGTCTEEEKAMIEGWYLHELKSSAFVPSNERMPKLQQEIWEGIHPRSTAKPTLKWIGYAAAIFVAVLFIYLFVHSNGQPIETKEVRTLVSKEEVLAKPEIMTASETENTMMKLADGSLVVLEKGSKLTVSANFNLHNREVELVGKAFFDIAHNAKKPFVIHTGTVRTRVLGTAFDITAISGSKSVKVNVIRGRVEVKDTATNWMTILPKNYQAIFDSESRVPLRHKIDAEKELSWNNQENLAFNNITFKNAKKLLEDRFHVKINLEDDQLQELEFTTSLRAKESLDHFLGLICKYNGAKHSFSKDSTIVTIKPLNQN